MARSTLYASFALVLAGLVVGAPARAQDMEDPSGPPEPMMETPYSAAQIASACPVGRKLKLAVEIEGEKPGETMKQFQLLEFKATTATGATIVATMLDDQGKETGDREESEVSWDELRSHAEFPAARTKRAEGEVTTAAGKFSCWIYTVGSEPDDPEMGDTVFWFAKELPGPPVKIEAKKKDNKSVAYSMTLVENSSGK